MKVSFQLRPISGPDGADALFIVPADPAKLLSLCARFEIDPTRRVFRVAEGLLLVLDRPLTEPLAGAMRFRALARNLFVPIDAMLVPVLLDDEATCLVRDRGLVFLARGPVLAFDPQAPLAVSELIACDALRQTWQPLPLTPDLPDRIVELRLEMAADTGPGTAAAAGSGGFSEAAADAVLEPGGAGIGTDAPRPDPRGVAPSVAGAAAMGAGRALMALGQWLGASGLSQLGARWIQRAMNLAPRLSEAVLGRQAAALRDLLNRFRNGDTEDALRHALPLGDSANSRGATFDESPRLPNNDPRYSLDALVNEPSEQGRGAWLGSRELIADLTREYRRAADKALRDGDYRRAAYIYGRLLRDYRSAANALLQGGLYRDAAVVFLVKLGDRPAAAHAFEAAGEIDRAVHLYRDAGEHEAAGDLLAKIGQHDDALIEYRIAADRLDPLTGGDLLLKKTGRVAEARVYFQAGWDERPRANDIGCGLRLARLDLEARALEPLRILLDQADAYLLAPGRDVAAASFYNELARLVEASGWSEVREELLDRSLLSLAEKMRQQTAAGLRPSDIHTRFLGRNSPWAAEIVRDAEVAVKAESTLQPRPAPPRTAHRSSLRCPGAARVTAVCGSSEHVRIFIGTKGGQIYLYEPLTRLLRELRHAAGAVLSLAADPRSRYLFSLERMSERQARLAYSRLSSHGRARLGVETTLTIGSQAWLTNVTGATTTSIGVWTVEGLLLLKNPAFVPLATWMPESESPPVTALLMADERFSPRVLFVHDGDLWSLFDSSGKCVRTFRIPWRRDEPLSSTAGPHPPVFATRGMGILEFAAVAERGTLFWAAFRPVPEDIPSIRSGTSGSRGSYQAVALPPWNAVAGVSATHVDVYSPRDGLLPLSASVAHPCGNVAACVPGPKPRELIVIGNDGTIEHVFV
jgi:tetratricopeptide (TPR) repeat protein